MLQQVGSGAAALLLFPGALATIAFGALAELAAEWALPARPGRRLLPRHLRTLAAALFRPPGLPAAAALLTLLAATQVAIPFSPLAGSDRNSLVAAAALAGAGWLSWTWGWGRRRFDPRFALSVQALWLLAILLPALEPESMRPQVLGSVTVPGLLPLKVASGALYAASLPALLQLLPETAPQGIPGERARGRSGPEEAAFAAVRGLLWLPFCGLFVSLFFPASPDDLFGLARFLLLLAGTAAIAIALAAHLARRPEGMTQRLYRRLVLPFAGLAVAVALLTVFTD